MRYYETPRVETVRAEDLLSQLGPARAQGYFGLPGTQGGGGSIGGDDDSSDDK